MRILLACLAFLAVTVPVLAQQRQPAQITTQPSATTPTLDFLDKSGAWLKLGQPNSTDHYFASYNSDSIDIRQFGCVADGVTDQAACINNAIDKAPGCVLIPATPLGFFIAAGSTVIAKKCLRGEFYSPGVQINNTATLSSWRRPWLKCATSATSVCVKVTSYHGAYIAGLTLAAQFPPVVGSIGLQTTDAYNTQFRDIHVSGFDRCAQWGPGLGISSHAIGLNLTWCQSYYAVQDGFPELYITDGRWGSNGQGELNPPPKAALYLTKTVTGGGGAGPNSLVMANVQVNPGGGTVECMVKWGGWVDTTGSIRQFKFIGNHWEFLAPAAGSPAKKGIFCSDSTVPTISQLYIVDSEFAFDQVGGGGVFDLDPATRLQELYITNSQLAADHTTLTFGGGTAAETNHISHSFLGGPLNLTGASGSWLSLIDTAHGTSNVTGTWTQLSVVSPIFNTWNDTTARGSISFVASGNRNFAWTPVVKFGGVTSTRTWTGGGLTQRTSTGGFWGVFTLNAGAGTETATGAMTVEGLPYTCAAGFTARPAFIQNNLAAGIGQVNFKPNSNSPVAIVVTKNGSTGYVSLDAADITSTTQLQGEVECRTAN